jgi:serine/threonine protein kinase
VLDENLQPKFIDFGFSCPAAEIRTDSRGTKLYYAPEVLEYYPEYEASSMDIFQLGITLYIIMFGTMPWEKSDYSCPQYSSLVGHRDCERSIRAYLKMRPEVRPFQHTLWFQIIVACLDFNPERRP